MTVKTDDAYQRHQQAVIEFEQERFEQTPVAAIAKFLESFSVTSAGTSMRHDVPVHVLEFLAERFDAFMSDGKGAGEGRDLDAAFGKGTRRQAKKLLAEKEQYEVAFGIHSARRDGVPYLKACEKLADELSTSDENIKRIYKDSKGN